MPVDAWCADQIRQAIEKSALVPLHLRMECLLWEMDCRVEAALIENESKVLLQQWRPAA